MENIANNVVVFNGVSKLYGKWIALSEVSLSIKAEEFVFLVGASGAGKSTLLRLIYFQQLPTYGVVETLGYRSDEIDKGQLPLIRRRLGYIFQDFRLLPELSVKKNIEFVLTVTGKPRRLIKERTFDVLSLAGLTHKAKAYPQELSGGEKQRVAIARALANHPEIILADEPTGNLDPAAAEDVMNLLLDANRMGAAVIIATHNTELVEEMGKRVVELDRGVVVEGSK